MVSICRDGETLAYLQNDEQNEHASFLQPAIKKILASANFTINELDAVAVVNGPGSYTGLRVGLASAKGICFVINKPLIVINSLLLMAAAMSEQTAEDKPSSSLLCPMIDARRKEVFTALYNKDLIEIISPLAMIVDENSFVHYLDKNTIAFFGDGALKWKEITAHKNALFPALTDTCYTLGKISHQMFLQHQFADLAYVEPFYLKAFFNG